MKRFITSDLHFGHQNIITYCNRPWTTAHEMNEELVELWNEVVAPNDFVYVLGDVCMGKRDQTLPYVSRLNGIKVLIPGNHDNCHPMHKSHQRWAQKYIDAGFITIGRCEYRTELGGYPLLLCHFPYEGDHSYDERYLEWRPEDDGTFLLHGHLHGMGTVIDRNAIDVGIDAWGYVPIELDILLPWIKAYYDDL